MKKMTFNEKMERISKDLVEMGIRNRVEEFRDYRSRVVRGVINVWVENGRDKNKVESYIKGCDFLGKSEVFVIVTMYGI